MKTRDIFENDIQISTKPETYNQHPDHEVQMARSDLYRAAQSSIKLHQMLKQVSEKQGLEGWVQAKITKAADYLESVYHYLDYEMRQPSEIEMEAAPVAPGAAPATPQSAKPAAVAAQNPAVAAAAAAKAAADAKKAKQAQIKALQAEIQAKQRQIADLTKSMNIPATVAEEYKLNYNVGDRVSTPLGNGIITAMSKTVNVDGKVKVKLDGGDESNVFKTTDLKHLEEMASAGASAAGGVASAMGGNGFANGGPGTLKRAKKPAKEGMEEDADDSTVSTRIRQVLPPDVWMPRISKVYRDTRYSTTKKRIDWKAKYLSRELTPAEQQDIKNKLSKELGPKYVVWAYSDSVGAHTTSPIQITSVQTESALLGKKYKDGKAEHRPDTAMGKDKVPAAKGAGKPGQKHPLKGKLVGGD